MGENPTQNPIKALLGRAFDGTYSHVLEVGKGVASGEWLSTAIKVLEGRRLKDGAQENL